MLLVLARTVIFSFGWLTEIEPSGNSMTLRGMIAIRHFVSNGWRRRSAAGCGAVATWRKLGHGKAEAIERLHGIHKFV